MYNRGLNVQVLHRLNEEFDHAMMIMCRNTVLITFDKVDINNFLLGEIIHVLKIMLYKISCFKL